MKLRWNFRCYPTPDQEQILAKTFGCCRFIYNRSLHERTAAYARGEKLTYGEMSRRLTQLRHDPDYPWLAEAACVPLQQAQRQLQTAFKNFFDKRTRYPSFRRKEGKQSAQYTKSGFRFKDHQLEFAKLGKLKVKWSRRVTVEPSTVTVIRNPSGRYFISMVVDIEPETLPKTGKSVGIDFGLRRLATLSNGEHVSNPRFLRRKLKKLAKLQKAMARKQKGSNRRRKARQAVARVHEKIFNCRDDHQKKLAWKLVNQYDTIFVEDLNLLGMVKNHNLARSISDASIGGCIRRLETKAAMHGKSVKKINRWFPSTKMCSACGVLHDMPLGKEWMDCKCGNVMDRDENAALNILAVGQTESINERGDGGRPN